MVTFRDAGEGGDKEKNWGAYRVFVNFLIRR